ncbi:unnamed protein product [Periconia digitata]|uniref:TOM13-domain-containing protein n=1 Tax=Periconia digitata TaxID=1303443 RepID=A0A9W4U554_9PLEO|nr:unnamed protein product [Periconia digitata]
MLAKTLDLGLSLDTINRAPKLGTNLQSSTITITAVSHPHDPISLTPLPQTQPSLSSLTPSSSTRPKKTSTKPCRPRETMASTTSSSAAAPSNNNANLASSGLTIHSDSETYDAPQDQTSDSISQPPSSSSSPLILYKPPTLYGLLRGAAINLVLPFVNGLMLGFGELVANEVAFRLGWSGTKVCTFPQFSAFCQDML